MKKGIIFKFSLILIVFFTSCDNALVNQDDTGLDELTIAELEVSSLKSLDSVDEDVNTACSAANLKGLYNPHFRVPRRFLGQNFPDCATVTVEQDSFPKTIIIEYGEYCVNHNGITKTGIIKIVVSDSLKTPGSTYSVEYINLQIGNKLINQSAIHTFEGENENNNIVVSWESQSTIIIRDSIIINRSSNHSKEWLAGFETPYFDDNIFLITGEGTININDRYNFTRTIVDPLLIDRACRFILSGIIEITRNDETMIIDYGDGECDNIAVVTKDGESAEIELISERFKDGFQRRNRNIRKDRGWW